MGDLKAIQPEVQVRRDYLIKALGIQPSTLSWYIMLLTKNLGWQFKYHPRQRIFTAEQQAMLFWLRDRFESGYLQAQIFDKQLRTKGVPINDYSRTSQCA